MVDLNLQQPALGHAAEYLAMVEEFAAAGEGYPFNNVLLAQSDFAAFVRELADEAVGIGLPPGVPAQQTYFLVENGRFVVGEIRFRPVVEQPYEHWNGHVGYNIRPSRRRRGYATQGLTLVLDIARSQGLEGVMVPIRGENQASIGVVAKLDGRLIKEVLEEDGGLLLCYWIDLA